VLIALVLSHPIKIIHTMGIAVVADVTCAFRAKFGDGTNEETTGDIVNLTFGQGSALPFIPPYVGPVIGLGCLEVRKAPKKPCGGCTTVTETKTTTVRQ
jgi:hypothetical protein